MLAAKRLLCVLSLAACCASGAAFAQSAGAPSAPGNSAPPPPLPNSVTPSASPTTSSGEPLRDPRGDRAGEQSPLLNPDTPWSPKTPLLPNASPDEPPLRAPLLPLDQ